MAMYLGRSTTAFSRALSRVAIAPPAARHLSTSVETQAPKQSFFPGDMLEVAGFYWLISGTLILDSWYDFTGRWKKVKDQRERERVEMTKNLERSKRQRKVLESLLD